MSVSCARVFVDSSVGRDHSVKLHLLWGRHVLTINSLSVVFSVSTKMVFFKLCDIFHAMRHVFILKVAILDKLYFRVCVFRISLCVCTEYYFSTGKSSCTCGISCCICHTLAPPKWSPRLGFTIKPCQNNFVCCICVDCAIPGATFCFSIVLCLQRRYGILRMGSPRHPPVLSHSP